MANYKNYFGEQNPLNLYAGNKGNSLFPSYILRQDGTTADKLTSTPKGPFESDDEYALRLQKEEQEYQDYIRRQEQYNNELTAQRYQAYMQRLLHPENNNPNISIEAQAANDVAYALDPATGEFKNPALALNTQWEAFNKRYKDEQDYQKIYDKVNDLGKALVNLNSQTDNRDNEFINKFKEDTKHSLQERGLVESDEEFEAGWSNLNEGDRLAVVTDALGKDYFSGETLEEFKNSNDQQKFDMLASYIRNSPFYESLASKHKEDIDWGDNAFSKDWKSTTDYATNRFLYGITGGRGWDLFGAFGDIVGGGALSAVGNLGELAGSLVGSAGEYIQSRAEGMGLEEDVDDYLAERAAAYIDKKSQALYEDILANRTQKEKEDIVKEFEAMSSEVSDWYRAESGTSLTELTDAKGSDKDSAEFNAKLKEAAKIQTISQLFNPEAAQKNLKEFWENKISENQDWTDKTLNTAGTFANTFVADAAAFSGVLLNPLFMSVDTNGSFNPSDWTVEGEGYSDALVKRNPILTWANNLQETGAWTPELQDKYKDLGVNALQIYKSVSDQNAFLAANDFYDIVGQYGFTAATTLLSVGGSAAVKSIASNLANNALSKGIKGSVARALMKKEAREALKKGLASEATEAEITAAKETAASIAANAMYKGNLGVGAMMGTAEGALEAKATYNTFMKDNLQKVEDMFEQRQQLLDNATDADLKNYMINAGYSPAYITTSAEGQGVTEFSPEQYRQARQELQKNIDEAKQAALAKVEDNAADAAFTNFISNSAINGFLNVFAKEAVMSRDVREASRMAKGVNKTEDLIDVVKEGDTWKAKVKKAARDNNSRNLWQSTKQTAKDFLDTKPSQIIGKTLKTAAGEFGEEYSQGLSDQAARDALQYDLNQYLNTVFDKDAREAFQTDWSGMLDAGLNSIKENATDVENLKAGVFGALSSAIGGFSPTGIGATVSGFAKGRTEQDKGLWGTTKWIGKNLGNLYQWGIGEAIRDYNEENQTAQRLAESVNAWLNNSKNQELLTHMGGAAGFKKALEDAIIAGDELNAHDSKLGLAVENIFMLQALKNTDYGRAMQEKIRENSELLDLLEDETKFDSNGNYVGNVNANEQGMPTTQEDWVTTAINTYKNQLGDATRSTNLTDKQIVERIGQNAKNLLDLQNEVIRAQQRVKNIFRQENLDPLAEQAFVYALMSQENTKERRDNLDAKLKASIAGNNLSEADKQALEESGLDDNAINFIIEHGSLEKAQKKYNSINKQLNQANEDSHNKKLSKEQRAAAKERTSYLAAQNRTLGKQIDLEKNRREPQTLTTTEEDSKNKPITLVEQEARTTFSAGDIAAMSNQQRAEVIANKERYSKEQQQIIDEFLNISRRNLASENDDIALTNEEVAKDYIDLATLERRADAYDRYLTEYINDPRFLSTTAATYRQKERIRTLRHLYKEDLQMRNGESVLDFKERLDAKIQSLKEQGKAEDADILNKLVHENKEVAKLQQNTFEAQKAAAIYRILQNVSDKDVNELDAAVQTVIANSGLSMKEIKDILDKSDVTTIAEYLSKKTSDGQIALNRTLAKRGLQTLDLTDDLQHNEEVLTPLIQSIKNFVDFYSNITEESKAANPSVKPKVVGTPNITPTSQNNTPKTPNNQQQGQPQSQRTENANIVITAPGAIDQNTPLGSFLQARGVSENVKNLDNKKNPYVHFAVIKAYGEPVIFAVQAIPAGKAAKGKTVNLNGTDYQIIGVVGKGQSDTLQELGKDAFDRMLPEDEGKLLSTDAGPIKTEFQVLKDTEFMSDQGQENQIPLKQLLNDNLDAITSWVRSLLLGGRKQEETENGEKKVYLKDHNNKTVTLIDSQEASSDIRKFPVGNSTLEEILERCNLDDPDSIKQTIEALKQNEFFQAYFEAWNDYNVLAARDPKTYKGVYDSLFGDFIFLGHSYVTTKDGEQVLEGKQSYLNPRIDADGYLVIDSFDKGNDLGKKESFRIKIPTLGNVNRELLALQALMQIVPISAEYFTYNKPQIGFNIIDNKSLPAPVRNREALRLTGLIRAGLLAGNIPNAVNRKMEVNNPFASKTSSSKSNDRNASQFDPAPRGVVPGGRVNPTDGTTEEGHPKTTEQQLTGALNEAQKKAQGIVDRIVADSKKIAQDNPNAEAYQGQSGTQYSRVTSAKQAYIGADTEAFDASEDVGNISHAYGNTVDAVLRASMEALNKALREGKTLDKNALFEEVLKDKAFAGKTEIPNWSPYQIKKFLDQVISLHQIFTANGWTVVPKDIRTFGTADVTNKGAKVGTLPIAGTLDLLVYDSEGIFHIIDIKSMHLTDNGENVLANNRAEWEAQVSTYQATLQQQNSDMVFGQNYILPAFLFYSMPSGVSVEVAEDGMTVKNYSPTGEPKLKAKTKDHYTLEDFLYPIDTLEFKGYEYDRLSDSDKGRIIPSTTNNTPPLAERSSEGSENKGTPAAQTLTTGFTIADALDAVPLESRRTTRQARYTEFINNHIAPVNKVRIGIVSKVTSAVKNLFNKGGKQVILKKELANIFFNGDTNKLELVLKGKKVTEENLPEVVQSLRTYFESYVQNADKYTANITRRYNISKAVYEYLKGNITQAQLEEELSKYQATPSSVTELVEYMAAVNKEEAAAKIISKLETSKVITAEKYSENLKALNTTIESMQAKLDFLTTNSAVRMLSDRINSVQKAIDNNSYEEYVYKKNAAIEDLLKTKSGSYGAMKLLRGISLNTKNGNFKKLANILLRQIKEKNLTIPITVEDGSLNFIEGSTKDKCITIQKTSLDSYEHAERVLLHEILHAVAEVSPEMRDTLQKLLEQSISSMQKTTGKTVAQIREEYYGLSSVDEFISEFFTNYAFQETLKSLGSDTYDSMFDRFIHTLKEKILGDKSLYNQISEAMESILNSTNIESTHRQTEKEQQYTVTDKFEDLDQYVQQAILDRGISKEEYDDMTSIEQEHLKDCCK